MKFAMCNEFCEGWDFSSACELAGRLGYEGIEIAPFTLSDSVLDVNAHEREAIRRTAADNGIEVVGLHWLLAKKEGLHINHPDPKTRARTADYLRAEIDFCADIGGALMVVGSPEQRNVLENQSRKEAWNRTVEAFSDLAPHAELRGVMLCIEPLAPSETNFINTASEAIRLVHEIKSPAVGVMLDVKAMQSEKRPVPDIIRECAHYLRHFHANDANLQGPGFGDTDFVPIAAALREIGYDGYVSVEVFDFRAGPERIASESLRYLKKIFRG